jgi:spermidine synthase
MRKKDEVSDEVPGTIIHRGSDGWGEIIVADDGIMRSLYFGSVLQSCNRLDEPAHLVMDYNRAMMTALLFKPDPAAILLVGLGGCSLVNFLIRSFPHCAVDAVEIREQVIDLADRFFLAPADRCGLKIVHDSGQDYIARTEDTARSYDLIFVDAFDDNGPAAPLLEQDFLSACRERLSTDGVFVVNLWNRPQDNFGAYYSVIRNAFRGKALKLPLSESCQNALVFGFRGPVDPKELPGYRQPAIALRALYGIDFLRYLMTLYRQNFD